MLISIDKYGSITLPVSLRRELRLDQESYLELSVEDGKVIVLEPVAVQRNIRLNEKGLTKLEEARKSGTGELPEWLIGDMQNAEADTKQKIC
ncbi:AbrB/MazE/SpoVT family DNA-binding domain-containing protein [Desulfonema magnum]|uniref:SpoVT-AbrB domain-containing protein n=1 Tax=Desulfonema magnum TaxID=45655 RepID=A0A975BY22_9BACT|nr:AbrB/MazE/SpoVT family DNA-binding domain-containing protein [Desulfonema magnum]QTA93457.1 SpoVT-AbrB domain-containing protein [Desulfonema magnum]